VRWWVSVFGSAAATAYLQVCGGLAQAAGSDNLGLRVQAGAQVQLTTRAGDRLTGEALRVDCHGLTVKYLGVTLVVPFDKITSATSTGSVRVVPGVANDELKGRLTIKSATLTIATDDLGSMSLPVAAIRCPEDAQTAQGSATARARAPESGVVEKRRRPVPLSASSAAVPTETMAQIAGTGAGPGAVQRAAEEGTAAATPSTPAATDAPVASPAPQEPQEDTERHSLEFLRAEAALVRPRKIEADFGIAYLHTSQLFATNTRLVTGTATARFGIIEGLEGFLTVPYLWGQQNSAALQGLIGRDLNGPGDVRFGLKYNVLQEGYGKPLVVLGATVTAPSGNSPYGRPSSGAVTSTTLSGQTLTVSGGDIRDPLNIQLGTGHWQLTGSVTALKSYDPLILFTTFNFTRFLEARYFGTPIQPGNVWGLSSGAGFGLSEYDTLSGQVIFSYGQQWRFNGVEVSQTGVTPISVRLALTHYLSPDNLIEPSLVFGVTRDANDAVLGLNYIHRF
jgi:hypothetical protein